MNSKQLKYAQIYVGSNSANVTIPYTECMFNLMWAHRYTSSVTQGMLAKCYTFIYTETQNSAENYVSYRGQCMKFFC